MKMRRGVLITSSDARVGKTLIGCALAFAARAREMRVGVMKPAETACDDIREPADARGLAYAAGSDLPLELICPYRYRSGGAPAAAAEADHLPAPDFDEIAAAYRQIASRSDLVIVEGPGGVATPISWGRDSSHLARLLNLEVLVVVGNRPGCVNAATLTLHYAHSRGLDLAGWVLNDTESVSTAAIETHEAALRRMTDIPFLGRVRFKEPVSRKIIDALLGAA